MSGRIGTDEPAAGHEGISMSMNAGRKLVVWAGQEAHGSEVGNGRASHLLLLLLLPLLTCLLFAVPAFHGLAGSSWTGHEFRSESHELRSADLPLEAIHDPLEKRPALTRGGAAMAAVESSRRKLRVPLRPAAQPLILTTRFDTDSLARSHARPWPWPKPALKPDAPSRPFPARGPPSREAA